MQICEYFFENACYSVTKYYLCKQNNKRSLLGRKQQHQVVRSFPNRYLFSLTNKVTCLFPISCILEIILQCKNNAFESEVEKKWLAKAYQTFEKREEIATNTLLYSLAEKKQTPFEHKFFKIIK